MNYYERPTELQENANVEAMAGFKEQLSQFNANCDALRNIERNLPITANDTLKAAKAPIGQVIQTNDGTCWQRDVDLANLTSVCHRHTPVGVEFAVVERLPLKSGEMKDALNIGQDIRDVLQSFVRDQRQVLRIWKDDVTAQVKEHLAEKYPDQEIGIGVESFEIKMARLISETHVNTQSQSRVMRI